jgi:hypothetical protein
VYCSFLQIALCEEPLDGAATFQLEPILKEDLADRTNSTTPELESFQHKDGTEPKKRSGLRSDAPTFELEEMTDHPVDTERTFDCVSIFILRNFMLG